MADFDVEVFMDYFLDLFKSNLDAKLTAITADKAADDLADSRTITIPAIDTDAYIPDMNSEVVNFEQFIVYSFPSIRTLDSHAGGVSEEISMSFDVVFPAPESGEDDNRKIMRYTRALKEVALEGALGERHISDLNIETFAPVQMQDNLTSAVIKVGGITITGVITS